jgi:hypothetical protein
MQRGSSNAVTHVVVVASGCAVQAQHLQLHVLVQRRLQHVFGQAAVPAEIEVRQLVAPGKQRVQLCVVQLERGHRGGRKVRWPQHRCRKFGQRGKHTQPSTTFDPRTANAQPH